MIGLLVSTGQRLRASGTASTPRASRSCGSGAPAGPPSRSSLWSRAAIWAGGAVRLARLRAEPPSARRPLGRSDADPRPRLGDRRLGALGQRLVPADRRARLRRRARGVAAAFYPLYPLTLAGARPRASAATTSSPGSSSRSRRRSARSCCSTGSPRPSSAPTAPAARSSTSPCSRRRCSSRRVYSESLFLVLVLARVPARRARPLARRRGW